jgi:hypothetical protein
VIQKFEIWGVYTNRVYQHVIHNDKWRAPVHNIQHNINTNTATKKTNTVQFVTNGQNESCGYSCIDNKFLKDIQKYERKKSVCVCVNSKK